MGIVLAALAEAIFSLIIEDLAQRPRLSQLRDKLRGDSPEKVALQHALAKTYRAFAETYPQIAHAFLDEHFLSKTEVATELATLLTPERTPNHQALIQLWRAQFQSAPTVDIDTEVDFFLTTLTSEIKSQPALKPFSDSRAFEQLYAIAERSASQVAEQQMTNEHLSQIHKMLADVVLILQEKLPGIQIYTGGGSFIGGDVATQGGNFISRDSLAASQAPPSELPESRLVLSTVNPFTDRGRINAPNRFFVRQQIVRELRQQLSNGNHIVLIGPSESGKSSLLYYLHQTSSEWLPEYKSIYMDMQGIVDEVDFCDEIFGQLNPTMKGKQRRAIEARRILKQTLERHKVLLMLDEVERLIEREFTRQLQDLLRAHCQNQTLTMLVASEHPLDYIFPPSNPTSPLHNLFRSVELRPFSETESFRFIQQRLAHPMTFADDEIRELWRTTQGHPSKIQRSAEALFAYKTERG